MSVFQPKQDSVNVDVKFATLPTCCECECKILVAIATLPDKRVVACFRATSKQDARTVAGAVLHGGDKLTTTDNSIYTIAGWTWVFGYGPLLCNKYFSEMQHLAAGNFFYNFSAV
jgi:hypothetical protein